jgi:GAF domain-containing protein
MKITKKKAAVSVKSPRRRGALYGSRLGSPPAAAPKVQGLVSKTSSSKRRAKFLEGVVERAVRLLKAKSGGIYQYYREKGTLAVIVDYNRQQNQGKPLRVGEGMAGRLIRNRKRFMIVDDYNSWKHRAQVFVGGRKFGAVLEVPLRRSGITFGVLYVDDELGRKFTAEDARLLELFGDQAAIALQNDNLFKGEWKWRRQEQLSQATLEILEKLRSGTLDERLSLIAMSAANVLEAESCGVFLVRKGMLSLEASHGHRRGGFKKGLRLPIRSGPKTGLTGHIAYSGRHLRLHGAALTNHYAVSGVGPSHTSSRVCSSILAIPLFDRTQNNRRLIGLLRVDNKKSSGLAIGDEPFFTKEDESILKIFADTAVVAMGSTIFVEQLRQTNRSLSDAVDLLDIGERRDKAVDFSQVEIDLVGNVTEQAKRLAGRLNQYDEQEQLLRKISRLKEKTELVVSLTAHGNHEETLKSVAEGTQAALDSDLVILYVYDKISAKLTYPPVYSGNLLSPDPWRPNEIPRTSISYQMLKKDGVYSVERTAVDNSFRRRPFTKREKIVSCAACPLIANAQKVGVMFVNYRTTHPFTDEDVKNIKVSASQAAVAIHNAQLLKAAENRERVLEALYDAGQAMTSSLQLKTTLDEITNQALYIVDKVGSDDCFSHVGLLRGDGLEVVSASPQRLLSSVRKKLAGLNVRQGLTEIGIIGRAVQTMEAQKVGDVKRDIGYIEIHPDVNSQLSVPLKLDNKVIGVLSIEHPRADAFTIEDQRNVMLLASQAAVAIKNAEHYEATRREKEQLESLHKAARAMAAEFELRNVLNTVVNAAKEVLGADSSVLLPYEQEKHRFIPNEPTAAGIGAREFQSIVSDTFILKIAERILLDEYAHVSDVANFTGDFLSPTARSKLKRAGIAASQGIALRIGEEAVGVLFVNYNEPRVFSDDDKSKLEGFASYAALSLEKIRLLMQVEGARIISEVVARLTALGDKEGSLLAIAAGAQNASNSDVVVMFVCKPTTGEFEPWPIISGSDSPYVRPASSLTADSLVYEVMRRNEPTAVESIAENELFRDSRFVRSGKFKSCLAFPLMALGQKVGVIFLNYRTPHYFTTEEINSIHNYMEQASVVILNSQTYDQAQGRSRVLEGLYDAGQAVTSDLRLSPTLDEVAKQALRIVGDVEYSFSHVALLKEGTLEFVSVSPVGLSTFYKKKLTKSYLNKATSKIGIAGRAAKKGTVQNVGNVGEDRDFHRVSRYTNSQLSVPLMGIRKVGTSKRRKVIGVLSIEHPRPNAFSPEDLRNIELLASQAAVAIQNAQQFEELEKTKGLVGSRSALAWMGMTSNAWRHAIEGHAANICNALTLLRDEIRNEDSASLSLRAVEKRLNFIDHQAKNILAKDIAPPYAWSEGAETFAVNDFILEWDKRLRASDFYPSDFRVSIRPTKANPFVRCSQDWLTEAFDILTENAVEATEGLSPRRLSIATKVIEDRVEIAFRDTGKGMQQELYEKLFKERIRKPRTKGLGVGLLMVQAIVQAYGGDIRAEPPTPGGTTMVVNLRVTRRR